MGADIDAPAQIHRVCTLPDAKLVVMWDRWNRSLARVTLRTDEKAAPIPYSLWRYRNKWINPGLAADHMLGLPNSFFYDAIRLGEMECTWSSAPKVPRAHLRVADVLAWVGTRRIRVSFAQWNRGGYLRNRYSWPEPR